MSWASFVFISLWTVGLAQSPSAPNNCQVSIPKILELFKEPVENILCNHPTLISPFNVICSIGIAIAIIAAFTGNLQKTVEFFQKYLFPARPAISESEILALRKRLLKRLKKEILERQSNSLHVLVKIDLQIEEQLQQVGRSKLELLPEDKTKEPFGLLNRFFNPFKGQDTSTTQLKPTQKIVEIFDRDDIQGKLLILGEPGSGKTTELLTLAQDLLQRAAENDNAPIPVIFDLATWKNNNSISNWLVAQLFDRYKGDKTVWQKWVENQQLIPLLDGLDELGLERQNECIEAIDRFLQARPQADLVVCCRREEYEQGQKKIARLNGAVYLRSLTDNQIQQYLQSLNRSSLWNNLQERTEMLELVRSPLFLTMLVVAYQGRAIANTQELFNIY